MIKYHHDGQNVMFLRSLQKDNSMKEATTKVEMVNHPSHYQGNKFEVIDIIEDYKLGFNLGNSIKYILRAGKKDDIVQDLRKAKWYLEREINNIGKASMQEDSVQPENS